MGRKISFVILLVILLIPLSVSCSVPVSRDRVGDIHPFGAFSVKGGTDGLIKGKIEILEPNIEQNDEVFNLIIPNASHLIIDYDLDFKESIMSAIEGLGGTVRWTYQFSDQMAIFIPVENLSKLGQVPGLLRAWKDRKFKAFMDTSVPIIKPALEWEQIQIYFGQKINGSGIKVAVLDTGINGSHWDIYPRVIHNYSYVSGEGWTDLHGHGTHVAGIIAGNGNRSIPVGRYTGMAPAAYLMNFKVLDQTGFGLESDILAALEDAVTNGSDVICFAIGTFESGNGTTPYEAVHQTCQVY